MRNLGKTMHAALAIGALAGSAACFSDPTSDLRDGPVALRLSQEFIVQRVGDDDQIDVTVVDAQGNTLPLAQPTYTSLDPSIATVAPVDDPILESFPGNTLRKAIVTAVSGGQTRIVVEAEGLSDTITVVVQPLAAVGVSTTSGSFGAGSILVVTAPAGTEFNTTGTLTSATFGPTAAAIVSLTATELQIIAPAAYTGPVIIRNLTAIPSGLPVDSVITPDITVTTPVFTGTLTVGDHALGTGTLLTITPPAGTTFSATASTVSAGATAGIILSRTATQIQAIFGATITTQPITVTNVQSNGFTLHPLTSTATVSLVAATFPGTVSNEGNLLNVITITPGAGNAFITTGANATTVSTVNGTVVQNAFLLSRSASTITAIAFSPGTVRVNNLTVGTATVVAGLIATGQVVTATTGETNEPGNNSSGGATALTIGAAANDSVVVFGAINDGSDFSDYYTFTMPATGTLSVNLQFPGNGGGSNDANPDIDVVVCPQGGLSGTGSCSYGQDIIPNNAASSLSQPENGTTPSVASGTVMFVRVIGFGPAVGNATYRLRIRRN